MSGLKSAWEISLEKSKKIVPQETRKGLTVDQKNAIAEIRKEFKARIADKELTLQHQLNKLGERVPPEQFEAQAGDLKKKFAEEKQAMEKEMDNRIEAIHSQNKQK
ncbi:MAG: hypothetical protein HY580_07380 [Nitrospinae bacterium]|nr:hypothetical protein [Nitrospinota bacterium]